MRAPRLQSMLLKTILRVLAVRVIRRYHPKVIGITGSVGKTTAKEAIYAVARKQFSARRNDKNYNNEFGVPMTVLGIKPPEAFLQKLAFPWQVLKATFLAYGFPKQIYPEVLVLEVGADHPGDIGYLASLISPNAGVVTAVGTIPVHVQFYASPEAVAVEKSKLIKALPAGGMQILNYDDQTVLDMRHLSSARLLTFGFSKGADIRASDSAYFLDEDGRSIGGLSFSIHDQTMSIPLRLRNVIGIHQIYGILAAICAGHYLGIDMLDIISAFEFIEFPRGRMNLLKGLRNTIIIDDSYNASPLSTHAALDTLREFGANSIKLRGGRGRVVAILGDMKELGQYSQEAHRSIGGLAAECVDLLIAVGVDARDIAQGAALKMPEERIVSFPDVETAKQHINEIIREGDIILVKGSQAVRLEKLIKEIMAEPDRAEELLVRQTAEWK